MNQLTLDDAFAAGADGIARADEHVHEAQPEWRGYAIGFVRSWLTTHPTLHCDDLWDAGLEYPLESRALGAVFQHAARQGWMQRSGHTRPSVHSHGSHKPVWLSLIFEGEVA